MLVLTRNVGENIWIGDDIKIAFLGLQGKQMRIGFEAPKEIRIMREELINGKKTTVKIKKSKLKKEMENEES